jgi:pyruvate formate lyase activating enzyme
VYGGKQGQEIPLHITRFFPRWHMTDRGPTDIEKIRRLVKTAEENLAFVYPGNC